MHYVDLQQTLESAIQRETEAIMGYYIPDDETETEEA